MENRGLGPGRDLRPGALVVSLLIALWLGGCMGQGQPEAQVSPLNSPLLSALPEPTAVPRFETAEDTGVVTGQLLLRTEQGEEPVVDVIIALGDVWNDDKGNEAVVGYSRQATPRVSTDSQGFFVFTDIVPGRYGFILDTVLSSYLLKVPGSQDDMLITMEPGLQIDMGPLVYDSLPLPPKPE